MLAALFSLGATIFVLQNEYDVLAEPNPVSIPAQVLVTKTPDKQGPSGMLLIPDAGDDRIMVFDPQTGDLIDANFIVDDVHLSLPTNAILSKDGTRILVADQTANLIYEYDLLGNYQGYYAPQGGADPVVLSAIQGISLRENGNLLVTVSSGPNANAIAEFDTKGQYMGNFIASTDGMLNGPFDVFGRKIDWLVSARDSNAIHQYTMTGTFITTFTQITAGSLRQIAEAANGNILIASYSGQQEGILEFTSDGQFVSRYDPVGLNRYQGVYELGNGHILTTNRSGVYEIDRKGNLLDVKYTSSNFNPRYIEFVPINYASQKTVFLPVIIHEICYEFSYNETLPYNLEVTQTSDAWQCRKVGQDIVVAVIDTGVDLDHPDLEANIIPGTSFVQDVPSPDDDHGHGTHVAGIVAAVANNGGAIGVSPRAKIMPIKVLDDEGNGSMFEVAKGIIWAAENDADIINLSLGMRVNSSFMDDAINQAYEQGILLVAAAGNCGNDSFAYFNCTYQDQPTYPGAYPKVMAVASTDRHDQQSSFSNQGDYIEVAAPGSDISSTYFDGRYQVLSGTSQATPHVAGLAALMWAEYPDLTAQQIRTHIHQSTDDLGPDGKDTTYGHGRINIGRAIDTLTSPNTLPISVLPATSSLPQSSDDGLFVPGELLVRLGPTSDEARVLNTISQQVGHVRVLDTIPQLNIHKLSVSVGQETGSLSQLRAMPGVIDVSLNYRVYAQ